MNLSTWLRAISTGQHGGCSNRNSISTIDEAFADCALPTPPGPTPLWGPGSIPNNWADVCGFLELPDSDRYWKVRLHGAFSIPRKTLGLRPIDSSIPGCRAGEQGRVLQGVLSRASFRQSPVSAQKYFTVLSLLVRNIYAKNKGIAKKLILTLRAIMISQEVDLVAGDFNGTAWRYRSKDNFSTIDEAHGGIAKKIQTIRTIMISQDIDLVAGEFNGTAGRSRSRDKLSTIDEAFTDCALLTPPGISPRWGPGSIPDNWANVCGFLKKLGSQRFWKVHKHGAFSIPRKTLCLRPTDHSCHHELWLHLDFVNWNNKWSMQDVYEKHISLKERPAACSYRNLKRSISEVMSDSLSS